MPSTTTDLLTIDQVAKRLQVSERTVREYCANGDLEYVKFNSRVVRFKPEWVDDMIARKQRRGA